MPLIAAVVALPLLQAVQPSLPATRIATRQGRTFDQTLIYGSHGDHIIFVEPIFTRLSRVAPGPARGNTAARSSPTRRLLSDAVPHPARARGARIPHSLEEFRWREAQ